MRGPGDMREKQDGPRNTVVVVEDDDSVRMHASELFRDAGIPVVEFANADAALSYIWHNASQVGAIFTDINTPGHFGGAELSEIVTQRWKWIFVLITSGTGQPGICDGLQVQFMQKPWSPKEVLHSIGAGLPDPYFGGKQDPATVRPNSQPPLQ